MFAGSETSQNKFPRLKNEELMSSVSILSCGCIAELCYCETKEHRSTRAECSESTASNCFARFSTLIGLERSYTFFFAYFSFLTLLPHTSSAVLLTFFSTTFSSFRWSLIFAFFDAISISAYLYGFFLFDPACFLAFAQLFALQYFTCCILIQVTDSFTASTNKGSA